MRSVTEITPRQLIDLIFGQLAFICDGHPALTAAECGKGFSRKLQTYGTQIRAVQSGGVHDAMDSGEPARFNKAARAFPTIGNDERDVRLPGVRSKTPIEALPLHKIMSENRQRIAA